MKTIIRLLKDPSIIWLNCKQASSYVRPLKRWLLAGWLIQRSIVLVQPSRGVMRRKTIKLKTLKISLMLATNGMRQTGWEVMMSAQSRYDLKRKLQVDVKRGNEGKQQ